MKVNPYNLTHEANVKFEIAYQIRQSGIQVLLEYRVNYSADYTDIFDIAVVKDNYVIGVIECKKQPKQRQGKSHQIRRYEKYGVPVFLADGWKKVQEAVEFAKEQFANPVKPTYQHDFSLTRAKERRYNKKKLRREFDAWTVKEYPFT